MNEFSNAKYLSRRENEPRWSLLIGCELFVVAQLRPLLGIYIPKTTSNLAQHSSQTYETSVVTDVDHGPQK